MKPACGHENIIAENILLWNNDIHDQDLLSRFTEARFKVDAEIRLHGNSGK